MWTEISLISFLLPPTGNQKIQAGNDVASVLNQLVEIAQLPATVMLLNQEHFQVTHLIKDGHVCNQIEKVGFFSSRGRAFAQKRGEGESHIHSS